MLRVKVVETWKWNMEVAGGRVVLEGLACLRCVGRRIIGLLSINNSNRGGSSK